MSVLYIYGSPASGPILTAYLGLLLYGLSIIAIGLFISSLTENQIIAAVISLGPSCLLWLVDVMAQCGVHDQGIPDLPVDIESSRRLYERRSGHVAHHFLLVADAGGIVPDVSLGRLSALERMNMKEQLKKADVLGFAIVAAALISWSIRSIWTPYQTIAVYWVAFL